MVDHSARDHAVWSASSTERNWCCPGALALTSHLPDKTNEAADWGTVCHEISEICLREGKEPADFIGQTRKGKKYEFEVDDEMAETAAVYVDYVLEQFNMAMLGAKVGADRGLLTIEQRFSLASLNPPFDAGGTADAIVYFPAKKHLEVIDLKGGRGKVVEVVGNPQLRTYALGAMLANQGLAVMTITVTIVQPRAPHKSGRTRSETFHVADLMEWTTDLMAAMHRSHAALLDRPTMNQTAWELEYLNAGDHCTFCKAAGFCPAIERKTADLVGLWFDDLDKPHISVANQPDMLSPERAAQLLDAADMIGDYLNALRAYWHNQAESGVEIPNYVLVDKVGHRKWDASEETIVSELKALDVDPFNKKLVSPAQAEKLLGAKNKAKIAALIVKPVNGTNLVRADKTTRAPATPSVQKHFEKLD